MKRQYLAFLLALALVLAVPVYADDSADNGADNGAGSTDNTATAPAARIRAQEKVAEHKEVVAQAKAEKRELKENVKAELKSLIDSKKAQRIELKTELKAAKDKLEARREKLKSCVGNNDETCTKERQDGRKDAKEQLSVLANTIKTNLEETKAQVEGSTVLTDEQKAKLKADLEAQLVKVQAQLDKIAALGDAATAKQIKDAAKELKSIWTESRQEVQVGVGYLLMARTNGVATQSENALEKIDAAIAKAEAAGKDVAEVKALRDSYKSDVDAAQAKIESAKTALLGISTSQDKANTIEGAKADMKASRDMLAKAHATLKDLSAKLRELNKT